MFKVPYTQLCIEIEKLYTKEFEESNTRGIEEHCKFIQDYIEVCGWSIPDYIERMWVGEAN